MVSKVTVVETELSIVCTISLISGYFLSAILIIGPEIT